MNILIYINKNKDHNFFRTKEIINYLSNNQVNVYLLEELINDFSGYKVYPFTNALANLLDCILILGGDGTFLTAVHNFSDYEIPCIGINFGRVGYLTSADKKNYQKLLDSLINKQYEVIERTLIDIEYSLNNERKHNTVFNEVVLHRGMSMKMIKLQVEVNHDWNHSFYADGMLVATSMGSSAYNLSAGGPLLLPQASCFAITSICSQSAIMPSIVVSDNDIIKVTVESYNKEYLLTIDGKNQLLLNTEEEVIITKSQKTLKLINIKNNENNENHILKVFSGYMK